MKKENALLSLLCIPSVFALWFLAFEWSIIDRLSFFSGFVELGVATLLVAALLTSLILLLRANRWRRLKFYAPIAANVIVVVAAIFVPFTDLWLAWDFKSHRKEREVVATAIFDGRIVPNYSHNPKLIALPGKHRDTSRGGGDVVLDYYNGSRSVYFFTFRGILGNSSGYLFMERDVPPSGGYIVDVRKIAPHWYWIQTT